MRELTRAERTNEYGVKKINILCEEVHHCEKEYVWYQTIKCQDGTKYTSQFCRYKRMKKMQDEMKKHNFGLED